MVANGLLLGPDEGEVLTLLPERRVVIKAEHELLDLAWADWAPGERVEPHVHHRHADAFYVLAGEVRFELGPNGDEVNAPAGTLVLAPAGVIHSFRVEGPERAQFLNVHAPGTGFAEPTDTFDPPVDGSRPAFDAVVRGPGEGDPLTAGTSKILFKAGGGDGDGTFMLAEARLAPNAPGPPLHRHDRHVDSFYVVEGNLTLWLGEDEYPAGPGSYGLVPPGKPHTFANRSDAPVFVLYVIAPGGFERYMKELWTSTPPGEAPDPALIAELATRHDIRPA